MSAPNPMPISLHPDAVLDPALLPRLKIAHADGLDGEHTVGALFLVGLPGYAAYVRDVVLLEVRDERSLLLPFAEDEAAEVREYVAGATGVVVSPSHHGPVCYSHDRIFPVVREGVPTLSSDCLSCPLVHWRWLDDGRRFQDCSESYRLLLFDVTSQRPCLFFVRGRALPAVRDLLKVLEAKSRRNLRPTFAYRFHLTTEEVRGRRGRYHAAAFGQPMPIHDAAQVQLLADVRRAGAATSLDGEAA